MTLNTEIKGSIRHYVWSGFYSPDEIKRIICLDVLGLAHTDVPEVCAEIGLQLQQKAGAERQWPAETDCDRLDRLFDELNQEGIIAIQNAGFEMSDGWTAVVGELQRRGGDPTSHSGFCFYHCQDLEAAVRGDGLYLTFGALEGSDTTDVEIGRRIKRNCDNLGFHARWDGTNNSRIKIDGINWQRRGPWPTLTVESRVVIENPKEDEIRARIESEQFAILGSDGTYIQCYNNGASYDLEYQDGSLDEHYQATDSPIDANRAAGAFIKYLRGDTSWRTDFEWEKMEL